MGVTKMRLALALLPLLAACAGGVESDSPSSDAAALSADLEAPEACGAVLTPDADLLEETTAAADRWSKATGCDVRVGEGGMPVHLVDVVIDGEGNPLPAHIVGGFHRGENAIYVTPLRDAGTVTHEIGHALVPRVDTAVYPDGHHDPEAVEGPCDALMCPGGGLGHIKAQDLAMVCTGFACTAFAPESD